MGIDRIDYTKGLTHKLLAIEMLLDTGAIGPDQFHLIQIAIPSRRSIEIYRFLHHQLNEIANRINTRFLRTDRKPVVRLITEPVPAHEIAAMMRASDLALITPVRDGISRVAIAYCS